MSELGMRVGENIRIYRRANRMTGISYGVIKKVIAS